MQDTETRTDLQRLIDWLKTYTGYNILGNFQVDYTDQIPSNGAVFPQGLQEVERTETILGDVTLTNQYNFGLYFTFEKSAEDVVGGIDLGVHLGAVLFQVLAETLIRSRSSRLAETRVQKMRHVFAFDLCHWLSPHFFT